MSLSLPLFLFSFFLSFRFGIFQSSGEIIKMSSNWGMWIKKHEKMWHKQTKSSGCHRFTENDRKFFEQWRGRSVTHVSFLSVCVRPAYFPPVYQLAGARYAAWGVHALCARWNIENGRVHVTWTSRLAYFPLVDAGNNGRFSWTVPHHLSFSPFTTSSTPAKYLGMSRKSSVHKNLEKERWRAVMIIFSTVLLPWCLGGVICG